MIRFVPYPYRLLQIAAILLLAALPALAATQPPPEPSEETPSTEVLFQRIAVAPILVGHRRPNMDEALDDTLSCPIDQICVDDPTIQPMAGPHILRLVHAALKQRFGRRVVPMDDVEAAFADIRLNNAEDSPRTLARQLGRSLSADLMIVGTVWRYRDRGAIQGFPDKPASLAFALYLVVSESGRQLWRGVYDETQEYALKDMRRFGDRIRMGLTWLSADELARHGVQQVFRPFPGHVKPTPSDEENLKEER